ncbi:MAG: pyridoxal-phosphate dependent enzyme [Anaerolineae bacterium]|nr:pyridoxal-phosphate dependent enzyme [Anaerolineae bacterium]
MALHIHTPLVESFPLSKRTGRRIWLKMENMQPVGSFKIRGIGRLCQQGKQDGVGHFVSSSGGNAGYAAAYAGRKLAVQTTVFVPETTPPDARRKIASQGAEVKVVGSVWDEADEEAVAFSKRVNGLYISPFDHPLIWEGHATIVDEIAHDLVAEIAKPDVIILSVGGGGLLCGVVEGLHRNGWQDVPILAVETEGTASLAASLEQGQLVTLDKITGVATSLGAKTVAQGAFERARQHPVQSIVVTDAEAIDACVQFADEHRCLVEPACGASLALAYSRPGSLAGAESVATIIIVCGGIGVTLDKIQQWREGR